jgi:hypothetical protein
MEIIILAAIVFYGPWVIDSSVVAVRRRLRYYRG